jgi:hypothetical protein
MRWKVCLVLLAVGVWSLALVGCGWSYASSQPDDATRAKIQTVRLDAVQPVAQTSKVACWAACSEMIFRYNGKPEQTQVVIAERMGKVKTTDDQGRPLPQEVIDKRIESAGLIEVMLALYPEFAVRPDEVARAGYGWANDAEGMRKLGEDALIRWGWDELAREAAPAKVVATQLLPSPAVQPTPQPLLVGLSQGEGKMGHVCLVYGMDYVPGEKTWVGKQTEGTAMDNALPTIDSGTIHAIHLIDPEGGKRMTLPAREFSERADFIISRPIAIERLERGKGVLMPR